MPSTKFQNKQTSIEEDDIPLSTVRSDIVTRKKLNVGQVKSNNLKGSTQKTKQINGGNPAQTPPAAPFMNNGGISSSRSSSTYIGNNGSYVSSNRSSSNFNGSDYQNSRSRTGRDTPSSDGSQGKPAESEARKNLKTKSNKAKSTTNLVMIQKVQEAPQPAPTPKKKGFSIGFLFFATNKSFKGIFSFFKKTKKKPAETVSEPEPVLGLAGETMTQDEIKAEETRLLREEEFAKLRRQREKEKNRTLYDMLPSARYASSEAVGSNDRSSPVPSQHSLHYPPLSKPGYRSPQYAVNNIRSFSTNNLAKTPNGRPATTYSLLASSPVPNNSQARDYLTGGKNSSQSQGYNPQYLAGHRSTDTVYSQHTRHMAPSPLIPYQADPNANRKSQHRSSSYGGPTPSVHSTNHHSPMIAPSHVYPNSKFNNQPYSNQAYPGQQYPNKAYPSQAHNY